MIAFDYLKYRFCFYVVWPGQQDQFGHRASLKKKKVVWHEVYIVTFQEIKVCTYGPSNMESLTQYTNLKIQTHAKIAQEDMEI